MTALFLIQTNMNNSSNVITGLTSSEIMYDFKIRNKLTAISEKINDEFMTNEKLKECLNETRFQFRQKAFDAIVFENAKTKIIHDKKYKPLLLKKKKHI